MQAALRSLDSNDLDTHWHYTMDVIQDGEQQIIHSNPERNPQTRRELVEVDGAAPDAERIERFRQEEAKRLAEQDKEAQKFSALVDMDTLNLLEIKAGTAEFAFIPLIPQLEKSRESLRGKLILDTLRNEITQLEIFNVEKLSPAFSVSVEHYRLAFEFAQHEGLQLLRLMQSQARGKAGFVKSFDSNMAVTISGYQRLAR